ncbi:MAG: hypothetical protein HQL53_03065 [Magnetococcales bacterium]|nr:hypothetical protein [Magnetococcales bacterium]
MSKLNADLLMPVSDAIRDLMDTLTEQMKNADLPEAAAGVAKKAHTSLEPSADRLGKRGFSMPMEGAEAQVEQMISAVKAMKKAAGDPDKLAMAGDFSTIMMKLAGAVMSKNAASITGYVTELTEMSKTLE